MVRIPRAEPTLTPQAASMPDLAGSGWTAPGRAMQGLGNAISDLSGVFDAFAAEREKENDFNDKMIMLQTDNEMGLNQIEAQATYDGTGDDYLPQRSEYYATRTQDALTRISPKNQQRAALFFEERRGPYLGRDAKFGGERRQQTLVGNIDSMLASEYGKLALVPPEDFETRFHETVEGANLIIENAPLPPDVKAKLSAGAADRAYQVLMGLAQDPETSAETVEKIEGLIEALDQADREREAIEGGTLEEAPGPQSQLAPQAPDQPQKSGFNAGPDALRTQANFQIIDSYTPSPAERRKIFQKGGVVVNLDTNWAKGSKPTSPMVVIPDNSNPVQRKAAEAYATQMAALYKEQFGVDLKPRVLTRSQNGRGRAATIHTEPYAVTDKQAVAFFNTPEGAKVHAEILKATLGTIPGVHFSLPHNPGRGDNGAHGNGVHEVGLAKLVLAELKGGGQRDIAPPTYALGGPKPGAESGAARAQNTIPASEPELVQEPQLVREGQQEIQVADASGRVVPEQRSSSRRSVHSYLRDKLIDGLPKIREASQKAIAQREAMQLVTGWVAGEIPFNPVSTSGKKLLDDTLAQSDLQQQIFAGDDAAIVRGVGLSQTLRYAPKEVSQGVFGLVRSGDPEKMHRGYQAVLSVIDKAPNAFDGQSGGDEIVKEAIKFRHYADLYGGPGNAMTKMAEDKSPEVQRARKAVNEKDLKTHVDGITDATISEQMNRGFSNSATWSEWWSGPSTPANYLQRTAMVEDYKTLFKRHYEMTGDNELSHKMATFDFGHKYGVTSIFGGGQVMAYPPENFYPPVNGSHEYMAKDLMREALTYGPDAVEGSHGLQFQGFDPKTGKPQYWITWKKEDGRIGMSPRPWVPGYDEAEQEDAAKWAKEREKAMQDMEGSEGVSLAPHNLIRRAFGHKDTNPDALGPIWDAIPGRDSDEAEEQN